MLRLMVSTIYNNNKNKNNIIRNNFVFSIINIIFKAMVDMHKYYNII